MGLVVFCIEYFALTQPPGLPGKIRYSFPVMDLETCATTKFRITCGSYDSTALLMAENEADALGPEDRAYHLDGYFTDGHRTYAFFKGCPGFDALLDVVMDIVANGKGRAASLRRTWGARWDGCRASRNLFLWPHAAQNACLMGHDSSCWFRHSGW